MNAHATPLVDEGPLRALSVAASVGRLHIVAIASLGTLTFGWLFTGHYLWGLAAVCALDWFVVNLLNRVVDLPEDRINRITGVGFVERHRRAVLGVGFGTLAASLVVTQLAIPQITGLRLAYQALGLCYNWPLLPGRRRLKQLYLAKNLASAAGFVLTVFLYPLALVTDGSLPLVADIDLRGVLLAALFFVPFELSYEVLYDLRDAEGDRAAGVQSFAVVHGERITTGIVDGLIAVSLLPLIIGYGLGLVPWRLTIMGAAPLLQFVLYKRWLRRGITARDCIHLTWLGAGLLAGYHLWILLGLPGAGA
ncbi:MAG: UbiA family prenyltransferase [Pseudomonadota bacterium]